MQSTHPAPRTAKAIRRLGVQVTVLVALTLLTACQGLYIGAVTLTKVVDSASQQYAQLYNDGLVPQDVAAKAAEAHLAYQRASKVAHDALVAYKASGDSRDYATAFDAAKQAAKNFVDFIVPLLTKPQAQSLQTQLVKATAL